MSRAWFEMSIIRSRRRLYFSSVWISRGEVLRLDMQYGCCKGRDEKINSYALKCVTYCVSQLFQTFLSKPNGSENMSAIVEDVYLLTTADSNYIHLSEVSDTC